MWIRQQVDGAAGLEVMPLAGESQNFTVNQANPEAETGNEEAENPYQEILNDLTLGEYDVVVTSVPRRETLEDSQFDQPVSGPPGSSTIGRGESRPLSVKSVQWTDLRLFTL